jgi:UBX domain-containing protein 1
MPRPPRDDDEDDDEDTPRQPPTRFTGRGVTLGGEGSESRVIADPTPTAPQSTRSARVQRILHLWSDGFSVDDGPLFRYDDPANAATLAMINQGRAPLELLNVAQNQEVDLQLDNQKESKFVQPKRKYKPFEGQGQRLGSPTPGVASSTTTSTNVPSAAIPAASSSSSPAAPAQAPALDASQPAVVVQIRLGDGTQLRSRFNTSTTVGELYDFVAASSPGQRAFVLMTTFPSKELGDKAARLEETELRKGGVVVQKWT